MNHYVCILYNINTMCVCVSLRACVMRTCVHTCMHACVHIGDKVNV